MTAPKRGPGRPRKNTANLDAAPQTAVTEAVRAPAAPAPVQPVCDCDAKLRELEGRLRFLEIRVL